MDEGMVRKRENVNLLEENEVFKMIVGLSARV